MEKTIDINGQLVPFKFTAGTQRRYRAQFGRDFFADITKLTPLQGAFENQKKKGKADFNDFTVKQLDALNFEVFENILWAMAKTADNSVPDVMTWLDAFEDGFSTFDLIGELQELLAAGFASEKAKKEPSGTPGPPLTQELFDYACRQAGLTDEEIDNRTMGMVVDYLEYHADQQNPETRNQSQPRKATQADIEAFF